jgi:hypothetical protein
VPGWVPQDCLSHNNNSNIIRASRFKTVFILTVTAFWKTTQFTIILVCFSFSGRIFV